MARPMPMFPLGSVLLPGMPLPLHVFEPRYRALVEHCLEGDREFGVVLIERGSEVGGGEVRTDAGTVARIVEARPFADGRWAVGAIGVRRVRVAEWLPDDPYPIALVEEWPDVDGRPDPDRVDATTSLLRRVLALAAELGEPVAPATIELDDDPSLAVAQMAALAPLGPVDRQALLSAPGPVERVDLLEELLTDRRELLAAQAAMASPNEPFDPGSSEGREGL